MREGLMYLFPCTGAFGYSNVQYKSLGDYKAVEPVPRQ